MDETAEKGSINTPSQVVESGGTGPPRLITKASTMHHKPVRSPAHRIGMQAGFRLVACYGAKPSTANIAV